MEWWLFQPQADITVLELANLVSKLRRVPDGDSPVSFLPTLLGVNDAVYDDMSKEYRRHFVLYHKDRVYQEYMT